MNNFVISLSDAILRREHICHQFAQQQISFQFFDAITPANSAQCAARLRIDLSHSRLSPGEQACLLSHITLWQLAVEQQLAHIAIYEDDVYLGDDAATFLTDGTWIPAACDVIKLEKFVDSVLSTIQPAYSLASGRKLYPLRHKHVGAAGYILSRHGAERLLAYARSQSQLRPADHVLFDDFLLTKQLEIYQMLPALCIQDYVLHQAANLQNQFPSYLESERFEHKQQAQSPAVSKTKMSLASKILREIKRPLAQLWRLPHTVYRQLATQKVLFK